MLKHHCEGFKGWWETCPTSVELTGTAPLTADQIQLLTGVALVFIVVIVSMFIAAFASTLPDH
jgi:hypothetical protein